MSSFLTESGKKGVSRSLIIFHFLTWLWMSERVLFVETGELYTYMFIFLKIYYTSIKNFKSIFIMKSNEDFNSQ